MSSRDYPQRVFALKNANETTVYSFGVGTYVGDKHPEGFPEGFTNPCIELDSGDIVWGFECWWGPESRYDETVQGRDIIIVHPSKVAVG